MCIPYASPPPLLRTSSAPQYNLAAYEEGGISYAYHMHLLCISHASHLSGQPRGVRGGRGRAARRLQVRQAEAGGAARQEEDRPLPDGLRTHFKPAPQPGTLAGTHLGASGRIWAHLGASGRIWPPGAQISSGRSEVRSGRFPRWAVMRIGGVHGRRGRGAGMTEAVRRGRHALFAVKREVCVLLHGAAAVCRVSMATFSPDISY